MARGIFTGERHDRVLPCSGIDRVLRRADRRPRPEARLSQERVVDAPDALLLEAIRAQTPERASVLDIGGGVGAIEHEKLLAAGAAHATSVDASAAFLDAAHREAERRGWADRLTQRRGDFVALADEVDDADVVTLDRVICCYPDDPSARRSIGGPRRRLLGSLSAGAAPTRSGSRSAILRDAPAS